MRTWLAAAGLALAASAFAQQDQNQSAPSAPPLSGPPINVKMPPAGAAGQAAANSLKLVDAAIKDLTESVAEYQECAASVDYLRRDLAGTKARLQKANGGKIPSNQAGLVVLKTQRLGRKQQECVSSTKALDEHFTTAVRSLAGIQPPNHAGIPPRRQKILQLREKFTAAVKKSGGKAPSPAADSDAGDESAP